MTKRRIGNIVASIFGIAAALGTMFITVRFLHRPESTLDWAVMLFAGAIVGIFMFFVVWGHFQDPAEHSS